MDTRPTAYQAALAQYLMGYDSYADTDYSAAQAINHFPNESIISFHGHGNNYQLLFWNGTEPSRIETKVIGNRTPGVYYIEDFDNGELNDVLFILYDSCVSAETNASYGNFVIMSKSKGVDNAMGFSDDIDNAKAIYWNSRFWYYCNNYGINIFQAASLAEDDTLFYPPIGSYNGTDTWVLNGSWQTKLEPARYGN